MNKLVFIQNNRPVTDSLTVAESFGKEHRRVMQDIRDLGCSEEFRKHHFVQSSYVNDQNRHMPKVILSEQGFALLAFGYTGDKAMEFKERYIGEFDRMKLQIAQPQLPQNYKEALIALIEQVDKVEKLELLMADNAPKVAMYDVAMNAGNNVTMERVSKTLGYGRNKLFDFLREAKVLRSNNLPYQEYMDRGYFDVRQYSITHFTSGIENKQQTLVTPKGMAYIHKLLVEHGKLQTA